MLRTIWGAMRSRYPTRRQAIVMVSVIVLVILMVGAGLVVAGAAGLAWTETLGFCTGCHEMRDNPYKEYKDTIHDKNRAGVRAVCSDCHVPREPGPLILRKMAATFEVFGHLRGVIDTREKFLAKRSELAHHVWKRMKETDSLECRNCHDAKHMDPALQSAGAQAKHKLMETQGKTCIDCHYGIAHDEPKGPTPEELYPDIKVQRWKEKPSDAPAT